MRLTYAFSSSGNSSLFSARSRSSAHFVRISLLMPLNLLPLRTRLKSLSNVLTSSSATPSPANILIAAGTSSQTFSSVSTFA